MGNAVGYIYETYLGSRKVSTDSRAIAEGSVFFALKGANFDGNEFVESALEQGAALCVASDQRYEGNPRCVVVDDVLKTLQEVARYHRSKLSIPVIGITGTNGKTTTKELMAKVLGRRYRVHATQGNLNNHIGVPLTLLSIPADCEIAVVEMGANHPGEIEMLCGMSQPTHGLITSVGKAHLEGFGSFEGVVRTKTELYRSIDERGGTIFVNEDNEVLADEAMKCANAEVVTYGSSDKAQIVGSYIGSNPYMSFYTEEGDMVYSIKTKLFGGYNFMNAMAALAVGRYFKVELMDIKEALEEYEPENKRSQFKKTKNNGLFLDCYNANPTSMAAAIDSFAALKEDHKMVFIGGMKELGAESEKEHRQVVERINGCGFERVVLIGPEFAFAKEMEGVEWYQDSSAACEYYRVHVVEGATILIKGSNSTKMWLLEEVL